MGILARAKGNQHGGRGYDVLQNLLAVTSHRFAWYDITWKIRRNVKQILQVIMLATAMLASSSRGTVLERTTNCPLLIQFIQYYQITTDWKEYQHTHTRLKFQILKIGTSEVQVFVVVVVFVFSIPCRTKRKPRDDAKSSSHRCAPRRAKPSIDLFRWDSSHRSGNPIFCFVCDPMCQIRKISSLFGNFGILGRSYLLC